MPPKVGNQQICSFYRDSFNKPISTNPNNFYSLLYSSKQSPPCQTSRTHLPTQTILMTPTLQTQPRSWSISSSSRTSQILLLGISQRSSRLKSRHFLIGFLGAKVVLGGTSGGIVKRPTNRSWPIFFFEDLLCINSVFHRRFWMGRPLFLCIVSPLAEWSPYISLMWQIA